MVVTITSFQDVWFKLPDTNTTPGRECGAVARSRGYDRDGWWLFLVAVGSWLDKFGACEAKLLQNEAGLDTGYLGVDD